MSHTPGRLDQELKSHAENHTGVIIFDKVEPRSIYNLVGPEVQKAIENVSPRYYKWSEKILEKHADLDVRDYRIRISFWQEYYNAQDKFKKNISIANVIRGVCTNRYLYEVVLSNPIKLAWILYPPADYTKAMEEMLDLSMRRMRDVLMIDPSLPLAPGVSEHLPNGVPKKRWDVGVIKEQIKIFSLLDNRLRGAVLQKVQVEGKHAHLHGSVNTKTQEAPQSIEEINKEIELLEKSGQKRKGACIAPVTTHISADRVIGALENRDAADEEIEGAPQEPTTGKAVAQKNN